MGAARVGFPETCVRGPSGYAAKFPKTPFFVRLRLQDRYPLL